MAFVLLLLVSLTSIVRVESQSASTDALQQSAEMNALLSLNIALGELQKLSGPDQVVSATGNLFNSPADGQAYWTGFWDTSNHDYLGQYQAPILLGWLVSGLDNGGGRLHDASQPDVDIQNPVSLLSSQFVSDDSQTIQVGVEPIAVNSSGQSGNYAFWVGDEGVKAKINVSDPHRNNTLMSEAEMRFSLMSSQRTGIEIMRINDTSSDDIGDYFDPWAESSLRLLDRINTTKEISLLSPGSTWVDEFRESRYHDVTAVGYGVLANTKEGGLKRDLTLAFEMPLADFNSIGEFAAGGETVPYVSHPVNYLFTHNQFDGTTQPSVTSPMVRGPTWHLMRNFYRLYKGNDVDFNEGYKIGDLIGVERVGNTYSIAARPNYPLPSSREWRMELPQAYFNVSSDLNVSSTFTHGDVPRETDMTIAPVVTRTQLFLSLQAVEQTNTSGDQEYRIDLLVDPIFTVWNPYNVTLRFDRLNVRMSFLNLDMQGRVYDDSGNLLETTFLSLHQLDESGANQNSFRIETNLSDNGETVTMAPGELIVFALQNVTQTSSGTWTGEAFQEYIPGKLQSQDAFRFSKTSSNSGALQEFIVAPDTSISFRVVVDPNDRDIQIGSYLHCDAGSGGLDNVLINHGQYIADPSSASYDWPSPNPGDAQRVEFLTSTYATGKHPLGVVDVQLKAEDTNYPAQILKHYNPRSIQNRKLSNDIEDYESSGNWRFSLMRMTDWSGTEVPIDGNGNGFWGPDTGNVTQVVQFEIPTMPLQSLASFQHLNNLTHYAQEPGYVIGHSGASPFIGRNALTRTTSGTARTHVDWSYLSNNALWDQYYFSTLAPRPDLSGGDVQSVVSAFANGGDLPNSRMTLILDANESPQDFQEMILGSSGTNQIQSEAYRAVSSRLLVDGAFNINSTSVEAWKALLSSTNGMDLPTYSGTSSNLDSPYSRITLPVGGANDSWKGFRSLSEAQIDLLAREIVSEVKARGPFVSISDFINRRIQTDATGLKGVLQAAIDRISPSLNEDFIFNVNNGDVSTANLPFPEHGIGAVASGAVGYLEQADLLTTLAPALSARSDTFTIRAYGDVEDPVTGDVVAKAWCEAVVQRLPDYINADENAATDAPAALSSVNRMFGRRYHVIQFRWLKNDEV